MPKGEYSLKWKVHRILINEGSFESLDKDKLNSVYFRLIFNHSGSDNYPEDNID